MYVADAEWVFDGEEGAFFGGCAVEEPFFHAASEHGDGATAGEMAVKSVVFGILHCISSVGCLVAGGGTDCAFDHGVAAELGSDYDECSVEEAPRLEVSNECRDRQVDFFVHSDESFVSAAVCIPVKERHVFGGHFDEPRAVFDQASCEEAAASEPACVIFCVAVFLFERDVERLTFL